jgi:hypothetical protein
MKQEEKENHLTAQEMERYRRRTLSPIERRRCDRHMVVCEDCLAQLLGEEHLGLATAQLWEAFTARGEEPFHLSTDDLERYVNGQTDEADTTIFESHLEDCDECREAHERMLAKAKPLAIPAGGVQSSFWERIRAAWHFLSQPRRVAVATALAACLLVSWVAWYYKMGRNPSGGENRASQPPSPISIPVQLHDGSREITIDEKGNVAGLEQLGPETQGIVKQALITAQLSKPQVLLDLSGPQSRLMGPTAGRSTFALLGPVGTVIADTQPTLRWQGLVGASHYVVSVFDTRFENVAKSPPLSATEWKVSIRLRRGNTYFWQVTALREQQEITAPVAPAPRAQFKVLDGETLESLEVVRTEQPDAHLTLAVLYARAGLLPDSEREFQALLKQNPDSVIAAKLLRCVQAWETQAKPSK